MNRHAKSFLGYIFLGAFFLTASIKAEDEKREKPPTESKEILKEKQVGSPELDLKLADMKRRIAELRAEKKFDEAEKVEREFAELTRTVKGVQFQEAIRRKIDEFKKAGYHEEAEKLEQHLRAIKEKEAHARELAELGARESNENPNRKREFPGQPGAEDLEGRFHHLQQAAEHLAAAGLVEQSQQLRRQAEMLRAHDSSRPGHHPALQEVHQALRQQNERIERLEQMMQKLFAHIENEQAVKKDPKKKEE